jgi:hypothetical protein
LNRETAGEIKMIEVNRKDLLNEPVIKRISAMGKLSTAFDVTVSNWFSQTELEDIFKYNNSHYQIDRIDPRHGYPEPHVIFHCSRLKKSAAEKGPLTTNLFT